MALPTSDHGKDIQNFVEKAVSGIVTFVQFRENFSILQEQNTIRIACRKSVVRYH